MKKICLLVILAVIAFVSSQGISVLLMQIIQLCKLEAHTTTSVTNLLAKKSAVELRLFLLANILDWHIVSLLPTSIVRKIELYFSKIVATVCHVLTISFFYSRCSGLW